MKMGFHPSWLCVCRAPFRFISRLLARALGAALKWPIAWHNAKLVYGRRGPFSGAAFTRIERVKRRLEWHSVTPVEVEEMTDDECAKLMEPDERAQDGAIERASKRWRMTRMGAILLPALYFGSYFIAGVVIQVWRTFG